MIPTSILDLYHRVLSWLASLWYGNPSKRMVVIGVTGTSGKTTTSYLISKVLEATGEKTGCLTTAFFKVADRVWENRTKMTMLGRFQLQKRLREMVDAGCHYVVIETTSQGILQHRHEHIAYDILVFTNLWPEHIEAHGGFDKYKQTKIRLFTYTSALSRKRLNGITVPRTVIVNAMSEHAKDFLVNGFSDVVAFGTDEERVHAFEGTTRSVVGTEIVSRPDGTSFTTGGLPASLRLPGTVNVENALAALAAAETVGMTLKDAVTALASITGLPGRYERIDAGQPFTVIVDYAFEPGAMAKLYELAPLLSQGRVIHVLGSTGGGRDAARRPVLGRIAGEHADVVIVTNEDPYDDDPREIINQVAEGAVSAGKVDGQNLFRIDDRREAIQEAIKRAQPGDVVLITGKGSEPVMVVAGGKKIPWSDAEEARKAIQALGATRVRSSNA